MSLRERIKLAALFGVLTLAWATWIYYEVQACAYRAALEALR